MKLQTGQIAPDFQTEDVLGNPIHLHQFKGKRVFMAFLRNTHCPLCSLHIYKLSKIAEKLKEKGLEIIVFYESEKIMFENSNFFKNHVLDHQRFYVVSDPQRKIYDLYGAELSPEKASFEALKNAGRFEELKEAGQYGITGDGKEPGTNIDAIPADFLIDEDGALQYVHYGNDGGDHIDLALVEKFSEKSLTV